MYRHLTNARYVVKRLPVPLHVIAVVFNPLRYQSRYNLFREFAKQAVDAGATLWVAELSLHDRPFELTDPPGIRRYDGKYDHADPAQAAIENVPYHSLRFRTDSELWHKERMINIAVSRLPDDWAYVAVVDADVTFINPDWVHETLQQLQHHQVVQMFTHAFDIGPNGQPVANFQSFAYSWLLDLDKLPTRDAFHGRGYSSGVSSGHGYGSRHGYGSGISGHGYGKGVGAYWHPGFCWAYRREAWNKLGGLLDINIVGGGDYMMAFALVGEMERTIEPNTGVDYKRISRQWAKNAEAIQLDIGAVPGTIAHHWHGPKVARGYFDRWKILSDNQFDPLTDLRYDYQMLYQLAGNKPRLRDDLRRYFRARNEDGTEND